MEVTKDMLIFDIVQKVENAGDILMSFGMRCVGCMMARGETLEQAAAGHGINVDELLDKLNGKT